MAAGVAALFPSHCRLLGPAPAKHLVSEGAGFPTHLPVLLRSCPLPPPCCTKPVCFQSVGGKGEGPRVVRGCLVATGRGQAPRGRKGLWAPKAPGRAQGGPFGETLSLAAASPQSRVRWSPFLAMRFTCSSRTWLSRKSQSRGSARAEPGPAGPRGLRQALLQDHGGPTAS